MVPRCIGADTLSAFSFGELKMRDVTITANNAVAYWFVGAAYKAQAVAALIPAFKKMEHAAFRQMVLAQMSTQREYNDTVTLKDGKFLPERNSAAERKCSRLISEVRTAATGGVAAREESKPVARGLKTAMAPILAVYTINDVRRLLKQIEAAERAKKAAK